MKMNLPVTGQEISLPAGCTLISRTDTKGVITSVNDAFIDASGYSREELVGAEHNISRHPDVPAAVFKEMWHTLKQGALWHGIVKNRCKNGDHYWVDARVVPVRKNGETIGYMSVRSVPTRQDIDQAETAYREAAQPGRTVKQSNDHWKKFLSVKNGVAIGIVFVTLMMIAGGILGISGLRLSSDAIRTLYHEKMEPVRAIGRITFLMADNRAQVALALHHNPAVRHSDEFDHSVSTHIATIEKNRKEIEALWESYRILPRAEAERELADEYWRARLLYVTEGLIPAQKALERGDYVTTENLLLKKIYPSFKDANHKVEKLLTHLSTKAKNDVLSVAERNDSIAIIAVSGVSFGIIMVVFSGFFFFRGTVAPLEGAINALERIAEGNLSDNTDTSGYGEPGRVMAAVAVMQIHLKVIMDEIRRSSGSIRRQCHNLNSTMMNIAQHSEEQHDRVYQTLDNITHSCEEFGKLAQNAEAVTSVAENSEKMVESILAEYASGTSTQAAPQNGDFTPDAATADADENAAVLSSIDPDAVTMGNRALTKMSHELAVYTRIETYALEETASQMNQVASLIVENRGEVQEAWATSQQLEKTANELDKLVKYFE